MVAKTLDISTVSSYFHSLNFLPAILKTLYVQSDNFRNTLCKEDQYFIDLLALTGLSVI